MSAEQLALIEELNRQKGAVVLELHDAKAQLAECRNLLQIALYDLYVAHTHYLASENTAAAAHTDAVIKRIEAMGGRRV